jgi:hypothetical protein
MHGTLVQSCVCHGLAGVVCDAQGVGQVQIDFFSTAVQNVCADQAIEVARTHTHTRKQLTSNPSCPTAPLSAVLRGQRHVGRPRQQTRGPDPAPDPPPHHPHPHTVGKIVV